MLFHRFIHSGDNSSDTEIVANALFRSNVSQFINDTETHPIVKYKAFLVAGLLIVSGLLILLIFNGSRIFSHAYWKHLFIPPTKTKNDNIEMSDAAIFREAIEGMTQSTSTKDGKTTTSDGKFVSADTESAEKKKKSQCGTDCGQYIELKGKINNLSKYVDAVKEQKEQVKQTADKLQELGKQIENLNTSLSPGGQLNIQI